MIRLPRQQLLDELKRMAEAGHLLVLGEPGAGKSWTLREYAAIRQDAKEPVLLLAADSLDVKTVDDFQRVLHLKHAPPTVLNAMSKGQRGVLLLDALDAARSEDSQRAFRDLIRWVQIESPDWSVAASVRLYDARQSRELLTLFPSEPRDTPSEFHLPDIRQRHLWIPPLTDADLEEAMQKAPILRPLYDKAGSQLRQLLHNPFYLWLVGELTRDGVPIDTLSALQSEVQLLGLFWRERVTAKMNGEDRRLLLCRAAHTMVDSRSLSAPRSAIYQQPGLNEVIRGLLSDELLREETVSGERLAFGHNMLFDYAVSRLLISEEPNEALQFLQDDPSRSIFLRPSLTYYFTRLWYDERERFWRVYWRFISASEAEVAERIRVLPSMTVSTETYKADDLQPLVSRLEEDTENGKVGAKATQCVLQSLLALEQLPEDLVASCWVEFLSQIRNHLSLAFVNEYIRLLEITIGQWAECDREVQHKLASCARALLEWMWLPPSGIDPAEMPQFTRVAAVRVVPLVCRTFGEDPVASRALLQQILDRIGQSDTPVEEVYRLAGEIRNMWPYDPDFVAEIYGRVFGYEEPSTEPTQMGSHVLPMTSTRQQDYHMAYFVLCEAFPDFMHAAPIAATRGMVHAVNAYVKRRHVASYAAEASDETKVYFFSFRGKTARYMTDKSRFWGGDLNDDAEKLIREFDQYLTELAKSDNAEVATQLDALLDILAAENEVAVLWKHLLEVAAQQPAFFAPYVYPLLIASPILAGLETTVAVGEVLKVGFGYLTATQQQAVEDALLALPQATQVPIEEEGLTRVRDRLLGCIPEELLTREESRGRIAEMRSGDGIPENRPLFQISELTSLPFTERDWLLGHGIDVDTPANRRLLELSEPAKEFEGQHQNKVPSVADCEAIVPELQKLEATLQTAEADGCDVRVRERVMTHLAAACETVVRNRELPLDSEAIALARRVLLAAARDPSPEYDPRYHATFDHPGWSPAPRIEAAQGLMHLAGRPELVDAEILEAIIELSRDPVPAVRFHIVYSVVALHRTAPDHLWEIARRIAEDEPTNGVLTGLASSLSRIAGTQPEPVLDIIGKICARQSVTERRDPLVDPCLSTITGLFIGQGNERANEMLQQYEAHPVESAEELRRAVLSATGYLLYGIIGESKDEAENVRRRAHEVMSRVLRSGRNGFALLQERYGDEWLEERQKVARELYGVIDEVGFRLFSTADVDAALRRPGKPLLNDDQRKQYYHEMHPLLEQLIEGSSPLSGRFLHARTVHHLMQLLRGVLAYDPVGVITLADKLCEVSAPYGYPLDSMAIRDVVKLVETCLADHRESLRDGPGVEHLAHLLDIFVKVGWPEAVRLVMRLEEVFR